MLNVLSITSPGEPTDIQWAVIAGRSWLCIFPSLGFQPGWRKARRVGGGSVSHWDFLNAVL